MFLKTHFSLVNMKHLGQRTHVSVHTCLCTHVLRPLAELPHDILGEEPPCHLDHWEVGGKTWQ